MAKVTGKLTDFGYDPLRSNTPRIFFRHRQPGVNRTTVMVTKPVEAATDRDGLFEINLAPSATIAPAGYYEITVEWLDRDGRKWTEVLPWHLFVPADGGSLADLLRVPQNPALVWTGEEPPRDPSPGSWWQNFDGDIKEFDGTGWNFKNNIRGPAGYNAAGAAASQASVAEWIRKTAGSNPVSQALAAGFVTAVVDAAGDVTLYQNGKEL